MTLAPGPIVLFGSGEAAPGARQAHAAAMQQLEPPIRACILETPAGFEPNSARVAGRLAEFLSHRFQLQPRIVAARARGTPASPDEPSVVAPIHASNYIMLGPGSPTYAVRQLTDSLAWQITLARHRLGAALVLASAAAIAVGAYALPVYEIYKVGEDLRWEPGLDLLGPFGRRVAVVPHWNNHEGGEELDTSHSYMGQARFEQLQAMLPDDVDVLGIDEHTAAFFDFGQGRVRVLGRGGVSWLHNERPQRVEAGGSIALESLGFTGTPPPLADIPASLWEAVHDASDQGDDAMDAQPPADVQELVSERAAARARGDWVTADDLRQQIVSAGWEVRDTADGPLVVRL